MDSQLRNSTDMGFGYMNVVYRHLITCDVDTSSEDYTKHSIAASFVVEITSPVQLSESAQILLVNKHKNILFVCLG